MENLSKPVIIIGGAAGAALAFEIFSIGNLQVYLLETFFDFKKYKLMPSKFLASMVLEGKIENHLNFLKEVDYFVATGDNFLRATITDKIFELTEKKPVNCIHPSAYLSSSSTLGYGNLILPNAHIGFGANIGDGCIINTKAIVEHDNEIGDYCQISPGATLCGYVTLGDYSFVSANATIIPHITIAPRTTIAAGSTVTKSIEEENCLYAGSPAVLKKKDGKKVGEIYDIPVTFVSSFIPFDEDIQVTNSSKTFTETANVPASNKSLDLYELSESQYDDIDFDADQKFYEQYQKAHQEYVFNKMNKSNFDQSRITDHYMPNYINGDKDVSL